MTRLPLDARAGTATAACCVQKGSSRRASSIQCFCARICDESLKFLRTQPILRQVAVAAIVLLLPVIAAALGSGNRLRLERAQEVEAEAGRLATTATALLDEYFSSLDAMASLLVRHPAVAGLDADGSKALFAQLLREQPLLNNVILRSADGRVVTATVDGAGSQASAPGLFFQVLASGRPAVSQLEVGQFTGRQTVLVGYPVPGAGSRTAAVLGI